MVIKVVIKYCLTSVDIESGTKSFSGIPFWNSRDLSFPNNRVELIHVEISDNTLYFYEHYYNVSRNFITHCTDSGELLSRTYVGMSFSSYIKMDVKGNLLFEGKRGLALLGSDLGMRHISLIESSGKSIQTSLLPNGDIVVETENNTISIYRKTGSPPIIK